MTTFEVALLGDPDALDVLDERFASDLDRPYRDRWVVAVDADDDTTLREVLLAAGRHFGATTRPDGSPYSPAYIAFFSENEDPPGFKALRGEVTLVDKNGRARWRQDFANATVQELRAADEAGVLLGRHDRPFFVAAAPFGGAPGLSWSELLVLMVVLKEVTAALANVEGTLAFGKRILSTCSSSAGRVAGFIASRWSEFYGDQGSEPYVYDMRDLLNARDWHPEELATVLGASVPEAQAVSDLLALPLDAEVSGVPEAPPDPESLDDLRSRLAGFLFWRADLESGDLAADLEVLLRTGSFATGASEEVGAPTPPEEEPTPALLGVPCLCGDPACSVLADYRTGFGTLHISLAEGTDHLVVSAPTVALLLAELAAPGWLPSQGAKEGEM